MEKSHYPRYLCGEDTPQPKGATYAKAEDRTLDDVLNPNAPEDLILEYDMGDGWIISLLLEDYKKVKDSETFRVLDGAGYGIIEDCGGSPALVDMIKLKNADPEQFNEEYGGWLRDVPQIDPE